MKRHPLTGEQLRTLLSVAAGERGSIQYHPSAGCETDLYSDALAEIRRLDQLVTDLTKDNHVQQ